MQKVDNDSESLKEELAACQHLLDDMYAEHGRQEVFNLCCKNQTVLQTISTANLNCAAKINLALGFLLQTVTDIIIRMKITYCWSELFC